MRMQRGPLPLRINMTTKSLLHELNAYGDQVCPAASKRQLSYHPLAGRRARSIHGLAQAVPFEQMSSGVSYLAGNERPVLANHSTVSTASLVVNHLPKTYRKKGAFYFESTGHSSKRSLRTGLRIILAALQSRLLANFTQKGVL